jgi:hypothetical protein
MNFMIRGRYKITFDRFDIAYTAPYAVAMHGVSHQFIDNGLVSVSQQTLHRQRFTTDIITHSDSQG